MVVYILYFPLFLSKKLLAKGLVRHLPSDFSSPLFIPLRVFRVSVGRISRLDHWIKII